MSGPLIINPRELPADFTLVPETTRCARCRQTVRMRVIDERGWCTDCVWMDGADEDPELSIDDQHERMLERLAESS